MKYAFMAEHKGQFRLSSMCRVLRVQRSGYYAWKANPKFTVTLPNQVWVIDITYIRTHEGWLYLTAVIDLYSRMVVGWAMNASMATELVLDALTMAVWRRRPTGPVMIHSNQGSQFGSDDFAR